MTDETLEMLRSPEPDSPIVVRNDSHKDLAQAAMAWAAAGLTVRNIRGSKARTASSLFNEFAAALQFPYYFGENWPAFDECLADLDWLPLADGLAVTVSDADQLLSDDASDSADTFFRIIARAATELGTPIEDGEWWDRPAVAFHVVLQLPSDSGWPWPTGQDLVRRSGTCDR